MAGAAAEGAAGLQKVREVFEVEDHWSMRSCFGWKEESWRQGLTDATVATTPQAPRKGEGRDRRDPSDPIDDLRCDGNDLQNTFIVLNIIDKIRLANIFIICLNPDWNIMMPNILR